MQASSSSNRGRKTTNQSVTPSDTLLVDEPDDFINSGSDDNLQPSPKRISKSKVTAGGAWQQFLQGAGQARANQSRSEIEISRANATLARDEAASKNERDMLLLRAEIERKKMLAEIEVKEREFALLEKRELADTMKRQLALMEKAMELASACSAYKQTSS